METSPVDPRNNIAQHAGSALSNGRTPSRKSQLPDKSSFFSSDIPKTPFLFIAPNQNQR
jgi:hypothetical protein